MGKDIAKMIGFGATMWIAGVVSGIGLGVLISQRALLWQPV